MESQPPSIVPPPPAPPQPGSAAFRSSSAPTTSVAPPPLVPGLAWPLVRTGLGGGALVLRGLAAANAGATARGAISVVGVTALVVVAVAALPLLLPRYRSFRAFSWLFLIACLCALQLSRDPIVHFAALKGAFLVDCESVS